jgi:beta-barrel assembly-enhancing protease
VGDSLNFHLVRARLKTMQQSPQESITYFSGALGPQKFGNPLAQRYGLVVALLQDRQLALAAQEFYALRKQAPANAMIATLAGQLRREGAIADQDIAGFYKVATQNFPQHRALTYDYVEVLLEKNRHSDALAVLNRHIAAHPNDPRLYELQARAYAALGRRQEEHHALAYNYILHGNLRGAIEQLELAKHAGNDFHELSTIELELKQFREIEAAHSKNK